MKPFETVDIILAAFLKVKGFKLQTIVRNGNRGTFVLMKCLRKF